MLKVRRMKEEDIPVIVTQETEMFGESLGEAHLKQDLQNEVARYYVISFSDFIVGYIGAYLNGEYAQILNFYIETTFQGKGYGKALLQYLMEKLKKEGVKKLSLEVRKSNIPAQKLYGAFGFKVGFVRKKYYGNEDAIVLVKDI